MKTLIIMLALLSPSIGSLATAQRPKEGQRDSANPLTLKEVHHVEKRVPHLKRGMSPDEVFKTLRLNRERLFGIAGGPGNKFHISYRLRSDYHLFLVFDYSGGAPGRLTYAELGGSRMGPAK